MFCPVLTADSPTPLLAVSQALPSGTAETASIALEIPAEMGAVERLVPLYGDFLFGLVLPVLLVLWLGRVALGAKTWPPWEVFRR